MEYVEREDEFDVVVDSGDPEGRKRKAEKEQEEEEAIVSIEAIDTVSEVAFCTRSVPSRPSIRWVKLFFALDLCYGGHRYGE